MATRTDLKRIEPDWAESDPLEITASQPAGRIVHDERGNAMWQWRGDTSSTGTASGILKHLDPRDLKVEGQAGGSGGLGGNRARVSDTGGGYDPYNQDKPRTMGKVPVPKGGKR